MKSRIDAVLAEHADDGEPVCWSWFNELGGKRDSYTIEVDGVFCLYWNGRCVELIAESCERDAPTYTLRKKLTTRGDVRDLLRVLGDKSI